MSRAAKRAAGVAGALALLLVGAGCASSGKNPLAPGEEPRIPYAAKVSFSEGTSELVYDLPRQSVGSPRARYQVPVGELMESYANDYIGANFESDPATATPVEIDVTVDEFEVRDYRAMVGASFEVMRDGEVVLSERYTAAGYRHTQPEDWEGTFELEQQVDITTDEALRRVYAQFIEDARRTHATW